MSRLQKLASVWRAGSIKEAPGGYARGATWLFSPTAGHIRQLQRKVGDGSQSGIVGPALNTLADSFIEPPIRVWQPSTENPGQGQALESHPAVDLWNSPNDHMDGDMLWWYYIWATRIQGNAYLVKVKTDRGRPVELWPLRPDLVKPKYPDDGSRFLDYWEYNPGGSPTRLDPADVIHLRIGLDPTDYRLGYAPLRGVLREILTDEEASAFTAALLSNMAIPGVILSPDPKAGGGPDETAAEDISAKFTERFSGDQRGRPLTLTGPMRVDTVSFSPRDLDLKSLRRVPEERITAALRVPAILANMGAGLEMSSGRSEARAIVEMFTERVLAPDWARVARQLTRQYLPDFGPQSSGRWMGFDLSDVRSLQEDRDAVWARVDRAIRSGWLTVAEGKLILGLDPADGDDVYLRPMSVTETGPDAPPVEPPIPLSAVQ